MRGHIWFLAQLFIQPELHALGIGKELLRRSRAHGEQAGARIFSVTSSTSPSAQALYLRSGMFAFGIGYVMLGPVGGLQRLPGPEGSLTRIDDLAPWQDAVAALDRDLFGAERRQDHAMYLRHERVLGIEAASFGLERRGELYGYGYVDASGWVAPLAAREPQGQLPLLRLAGDWLAARSVENGRMWVLSLNPTIMRALLEGGWRIDQWTFLKATAPFGKFDRYHPSGGLLL